jgi:hypothetical protein
MPVSGFQVSATWPPNPMPTFIISWHWRFADIGSYFGTLILF